MMTAALQSAGAEMALVGVTVLTSHTSESYGRTVGRGAVVVEHEVSRLATLAQEAGLAGVVCSPNEIHTVRATMPPDGLIVTPGIRRADDAVGDQARAATPRAAAQAGATHIVVGRPVLQASDPGAAFREIAEEARCEH